MSDNLAHQRLIENYCCAQCWGVLVEKCIEGKWIIVCPRACQPGGFVTQAWVAKYKAENHLEAAEVSRNYPQFADKPLSVDERQRMKRALYGEGE